jgi:hypothetical protein
VSETNSSRLLGFLSEMSFLLRAYPVDTTSIWENVCPRKLRVNNRVNDPS